EEQVAEGVELLDKQIKDMKLDSNAIICCNGTDIYPTIKGLIANKIAQEYKRPCLVLANKDGNYSGSGRGYEKGWLKDLKAWMESNPYVSGSYGHSNAQGNYIDSANISNFFKSIQDIPKACIENIDLSDEVDDIYNASQINSSLVNYIGEYEYLWGNGLEQPLFYVENIIVQPNNIKILGSEKNTLKFTSNGLDYIVFKQDPKELEELFKSNETNPIEFNVTCRFTINKWKQRGYIEKCTPQCVVDKMEYKIMENNCVFF
ncbi:MAG: DHHA1 domain-containing protein, partial [Clostridium sp.]|uniref:hypothetical protein n=1 Tax=Clostridium sp. TaxID=1506 RepID=UPI003F381876